MFLSLHFTGIEEDVRLKQEDRSLLLLQTLSEVGLLGEGERERQLLASLWVGGKRNRRG